MIVITHLHNKIKNVFNYNTNEIINVNTNKPTQALFQLAKNYPDSLIAWCHNDLKDCINDEGFKKIFHHKLIMASFEIRETNYISDRIGYVESSPFINIKKNVTYPTWLMSSCIGAIYAEILLMYDSKIYQENDLDYVLNSIAKRGMIKGLFCYSSPELLNQIAITIKPFKNSSTTLYKFIKQHYKTRWTYITFFNSLIYDRKLQILPLLKSFLVAKKEIELDFKSVEIKSTKTKNLIQSIDVLIPTIGRKQFLYSVLKDLSKQTFKPKKVIVVEQNSELKSNSDLEFLKKQIWPFEIDHIFTHQTGACNARNLALNKIESDVVFFADDDIRLEENVLEKAIESMTYFGLNSVTLSCLQEDEKEIRNNIIQWHTFGSGCSIVKSDVLNNITYDMAFEHGFGEDGDFGMQLRNTGVDIGYLPHCSLLHLKAPIGGFRTKFVQPWENDKIQPKPSPTIMLYNLKHQSQSQVLGYKTLIFFKFFKLQSNKNVITYILQMKKRWDKSVFWAQQLKSKNQ